MGFRFRRSIRVMPGWRVNVSKSGLSSSFGTRGAWFTVGPRGTRETIGIPGSGISYTTQRSWRRPQNHPADSVDPATAHGDFLRGLISIIVVMAIIGFVARLFAG
jgi:hypothetical protein